MKRRKNSPTVLAILLVLLSTAASDVSRAQRANGAARLTVSVTVPPICTVAVTPGQSADAIAVRCRNLPAAHPKPVVTEARASNDAAAITGSRPEVLETSLAGVDPLDPVPSTDSVDPVDPVDPVEQVAMVVINF